MSLQERVDPHLLKGALAILKTLHDQGHDAYFDLLHFITPRFFKAAVGSFYCWRHDADFILDPIPAFLSKAQSIELQQKLQ